MAASAAHHNVATAPPVPAGGSLESRTEILRHPSGTRSSSQVSPSSRWDLHRLLVVCFINREMADHGRAQGRNELGHDRTTSMLALAPGAIMVVPAAWTTVTTFQRIQGAQRLHSRVPINGWIGLILALVLSPALYGFMQSGLNSAWSAAHEGTWQLLS
jgi:hypothetical protein